MRQQERLRWLALRLVRLPVPNSQDLLLTLVLPVELLDLFWASLVFPLLGWLLPRGLCPVLALRPALVLVPLLRVV